MVLSTIVIALVLMLRAGPGDRNSQSATMAAATAPRTTVNFDYAWRYQPGGDRKYVEHYPNPEFNVSFADPSAPGQIWTGTLGSRELCCNECANHDTCRAWDWSGRWCWITENPTVRKASPGRWSGRMSPDWPGNATHPARSQLSFDDSAWTIVDAPHDYGRTHELHCQATGRRRRGFDQELPDLDLADI